MKSPQLLVSSKEYVAQGCSLSPILFSVFISDLLEEIDRAQVGIQLKSGIKVGGLLFADDFLGITKSSENLQQLIDIIYEFCGKCYFLLSVCTALRKGGTVS